MLKLILGRAGSGKTSGLMKTIAESAEHGTGGHILIVPEQYSHEAERELCAVCGDGMSMYAEVLSFTRLARRVADETGSGKEKRPTIDKGGRLLCMALCLNAIGQRLTTYGDARRRPELQRSLLAAYDELKAAGIEPKKLEEAANVSGDVLGGKLRDMALVMDGFAAVTANVGADQSDAITELAENISRSSLGKGGFYLDGFTDFTFQELSVIREMLRMGRNVTVCLTCDENDGTDIFLPSLRTAAILRNMAAELGTDAETEKVSAVSYRLKGSLGVFEKYMADWPRESFEDGENAVSLCSCGNITQECEMAAAHCLELVREKNCRWRDIAIAVRGFDDYRSGLESAFERYGVPLFTTRRGSIGEKPLPVLINSVFEIISGWWDYEDVFTSLKTGLWGFTPEQIDELENYVITWGVSGSQWTGDDWRLNPGGNNKKYTEADNESLRRINEMRRKIAEPVSVLAEAGKREKTAIGQVRALDEFLNAIGLAETLKERASRLHARGQTESAAEYVQLWDITVNAMEQFAAILGETEMNQDEFARLFRLLLSCYDVSAIPVSSDSVSAGDMDRMRRRNIKHLIVLGASDNRLPRISDETGVFSADEKDKLQAAGIDLGGSGENLYREMSLIYNCLTLPSETLTMSYTRYNTEGAEARPAFVMQNAARLFDKKILPADMKAVKRAAPETAFEMAVSGRDAEAEAYFRETGRAQKLDDMKKAASAMRGHLSARSVKALYGPKPGLTASRADSFASCKYSYFLEYGLRLKPREPAGFDPPQYGSFMHYVLENVARRVSKMGGFGKVEREEIEKLTDEYVEEYIHTVLQDFRQRSERFIYLFKRLTTTVRRVVCDMAAELAVSSFEPLDFELRFSNEDGSLPPVVFGEGDKSVNFTGVADRVDGWVHDGKLYVRVMDYKTGKKAFSLSDVYRGMSLQMLLYLFALEREGEMRYGREIVPAGVLYVPARSVTVSADNELTDEEAAQERSKQLRRSGLVLNSQEVLAAMENSESPSYIPIKYSKDGKATGEALAGAEQLGQLSGYIDELLSELAGELHGGSIEADPYYRSQSDNACRFCKFADACLFTEGQDQRRYLEKLKADDVWEKIEERMSENTGNTPE